MTVRATLSTEMLVPCMRALSASGPEIEQRAVESGLAILARHGLELASFGNLGERIPHRTALDLLDNAVAVTGDPGFALRAGDGAQRGDFGLFDFVTRSAATLGESMRLAARLLPLLHDGADIHLAEEGDLAIWRHRLRGDLLATASANEYVVAAFFRGARQAVGLDAAPLQVSFAHAEPAHAEAYVTTFLGASLDFGRDANTIVFPRLALDLPLTASDPPLHALLLAEAEHRLDTLPRFQPFTEHVREQVRARIETGAQLGTLAAALNMSESTLRRRLAAEGVTHSELVDGVRRELALELLGRRELNISEVAFRLGFSHRPAFHRAFRRWFGMAPSEHRARNAGTAFSRFYGRRTPPET